MNKRTIYIPFFIVDLVPELSKQFKILKFPPFLYQVYCVGCDPGSLPSFEMMALFGCKARVLRGPACTINDLFDRDIDRKVSLFMWYNDMSNLYPFSMLV